MPLPSAAVGAATEPITDSIDARRLMAYAAGIGDHRAEFLVTGRAQPIVGHPCFTVSVEWPVVLAARRLDAYATLGAMEVRRGVHATQDTTIHRLIGPGDELATTATVVTIERRTPGAYEVLRLDTTTTRGEPIATTYMGSLFLGVDVDGPDTAIDGPAEAPDRTPVAPETTEVRRLDVGAAHVYTECARIWNPIHTDAAVAASSGLPHIILHGTASLAIAVSHALTTGHLEPGDVRRVCARFGAMVGLPGTIRFGATPTAVGLAVEATLPDGARAIRDGSILLR